MGREIARLVLIGGSLAVALVAAGCRAQGSVAPATSTVPSPPARGASCDDALGKAPLGAGAVSALIGRLSFKKAHDSEQLAQVVSVPAPLAEGTAAPDAGAMSEVKRQVLADGRCAAWLQTELSPGAPSATSAGVLVIVLREDAIVRVQAATRYDGDEGSFGFGPSRRYGALTLYVAKGDDVGTGAQESGSSECIWSISKDQIESPLCYYSGHSDRPLSGAGWVSDTTTSSSLSSKGVVLHTHVTQRWAPPTEEQKNCRPRWLREPDSNWQKPHELTYDFEQLYALEGMGLTAKGTLPDVPRRDSESLVPVAIDDQVTAWNLPPIVGSFSGNEADLNCDPEPAE